MEPEFVNRCVMTRAVLRETERVYLLRTGPQSVLNIVMWIAVAANVAMMIPVYLQSGITIDLYVGLFLLSTMLFFLLLDLCFIPASAAKKLYKWYLLISGGKEAVNVTEFGEQIVVYVEGRPERAVYAYENIRRVVKTKHLYILQLDYKMGIILRKDGFVKGDPAAFLQLARERRGQG